MSSSPSILITHPGRQHSHQLAVGLHTHGMLAAYWTGVPATNGPEASLLTRAMARASPHDVLPLPASRVRHWYVAPLLRRVAEGLLPPRHVVWWLHYGSRQFDRWCAYQLTRASDMLDGLDAVVCYENSALHTFRAAKERGLTTILDAASFHYGWQDAVYEYIEPAPVHEKINQHKDQELALADHVLTVSELARHSYITGGVPPEKVQRVLLGCDLSRFTSAPAEAQTQSAGERAPFRFIFAGHASERKGIDVLLDASRSIYQDFPHEVQLIGGESTAIDWARYPWVDVVGRVPQATLAEYFRQGDCLVLPSRHDSFGMVVVEAMASGLPVIVSEQVGAKEIVRPGENGWVVPAEDPEALARCMKRCITAPEQLQHMGRAAADTAQQYTWSAYHHRVSEVLDALLSPAA